MGLDQYAFIAKAMKKTPKSCNGENTLILRVGCPSYIMRREGLICSTV